MKRLYWFSALSLLAVIFLVEYDLSRRLRGRTEQALVSAVETPSVASEPESVVTDNTSFFESLTLREAQKLEQLNNNPKTLDQRMEQLALGLSPLEIRKLAVVARSKDETEDRRALAIELLSRSKTPDAVEMLKDFIVTRHTNTESVDHRAREIESVLKVQAIEGIAAYPKKETALSYLDSLAGEVSEGLLRDRIARSEAVLRGRVETRPQKDETVLKQLVQ